MNLNNSKIREVFLKINEDLSKINKLNFFDRIVGIQALVKHGLTLVAPTAEELEIEKCENDPIYFIERYVKVSGKLIVLFDWQKEYINSLLKENRIYVKKQRQIGFTFIQCAYLVWKSIFKNVKIVIIGTSQTSIQCIRSLISRMYRELEIVKYDSCIKIDNKTEIRLINGSIIWFLTKYSVYNGCRGLSIDLLYIDEGEFVLDDGKLLPCIYPMLNPTSQFIIGSTKKTMEYKCIPPNFTVFRLKWDAVPNRDINWLLTQIRNFGLEVVEREFIP